jgi:uncharacterized protein YjiS (DUF1127 family)
MATILAETFRRSSRPERAASMIVRAVAAVLQWHALASERRHLAGLDDRMLRDIGLTRADVEREYRKPFWQA